MSGSGSEGGRVKPSSDVAFSASVKQVQQERGSRAAYARLERAGGFATEIDDDLRAFLARIDTAFLATAIMRAGSTPIWKVKTTIAATARAEPIETRALAGAPTGSRMYM